MVWALHGNVGMARDWDAFSFQLGKSLKEGVVRGVDLWRYQACRVMGLKEFGEVFASEVQAQDSDPILVGYSMGGRLALHAVRAQPKLWREVILISTHPGLRSEDEKSRRRSSDAEWGVKAYGMEWGQFLQEWGDQSVFGEGASIGLGDRRMLSTRRLEVARAFSAWSLGEQADLREGWEGVSCPVTLITGERDVKYTKLAKEFCFSRGRHIVVPEVGHRPLWEGGEQMLGLLEVFR